MAKAIEKVKLPAIQKSSLQILSEATPQNKIKQRPGPGGMTLNYVEIGYVVNKLDEAFNHLWEFEILDEKVGETQVWVKGRLTVHLAPDFSLKKEAYGGATIKKFKEGGVIDVGNDMKAAASDSLKKCSSLLGVAKDVYYPNEVEKLVEKDCDKDHEKLMIKSVQSGANRGREFRACDKCNYFRWMKDENREES